MLVDGLLRLFYMLTFRCFFDVNMSLNWDIRGWPGFGLKNSETQIKAKTRKKVPTIMYSISIIISSCHDGTFFRVVPAQTGRAGPPGPPAGPGAPGAPKRVRGPNLPKNAKYAKYARIPKKGPEPGGPTLFFRGFFVGNSYTGRANFGPFFWIT